MAEPAVLHLRSVSILATWPISCRGFYISAQFHNVLVQAAELSSVLNSKWRLSAILNLLFGNTRPVTTHEVLLSTRSRLSNCRLSLYFSKYCDYKISQIWSETPTRSRDIIVLSVQIYAKRCESPDSGTPWTLTGLMPMIVTYSTMYKAR